MSLQIAGWAEVTVFPPTEQDSYSWRGVLRLAPLIDTDDSVSERLFGLSKRCIRERSFGGLVAQRGIPSNVSIEVRSALEGIHEHEERFGVGEIGGYTHATWRELKAAQSELQLSESSWRVVFDILARIEKDFRFTADRIRLIVWYEW